MSSSRRPISSTSCLQVARLSLEGDPEAPDHSLETPHSPLYADPYTPPATSHHKIRDIRGLDEVSSLLVMEWAGGATACCLGSGAAAPGPGLPPPEGQRKPEVCWGHERLQGLVGRGPKSPMLCRQFLTAMKSSRGPEPSSLFPSVPVSVPVSDPRSAASGPHLLSRKGALQGRASQRHRGSKGREPRPPDSPQLVSSSPHPGQ